MTVKVQGLLLPGRQLSGVTVSGVVDAVDTNGIAIYAGSSIPDWQQLEVFNAWKRAAEGARDNNVMQNLGSVWYSGYPITEIDENSRITSATFGDFGVSDVFIGMGAGVVAEFHDWVNIIDFAFEKLRDTALEQYFKAA